MLARRRLYPQAVIDLLSRYLVRLVCRDLKIPSKIAGGDQDLLRIQFNDPNRSLCGFVKDTLARRGKLES